MARNLAEYGAWGIAPTEFAAASSSPLWTLTLGALWRLGVHTAWLPLALNVAAGIGVLVVVDRILFQLSARSRAGVLAILVLATPMSTLALVGMEHTLFILLAVAFLWRMADSLTDARWRGTGGSALLAALLVGTRYEGLFIVAAVAGILASRGRRARALALCAVAAVPVLAWRSPRIRSRTVVWRCRILCSSSLAQAASTRSRVESRPS